MPDQSNLKDDVHDPVNVRLDAKDGRPNFEDAFSEGKAPISAEVESPHNGGVPQEAEHHEDLSDFAANVMAGLNDVGITVEADRDPSESDSNSAVHAHQNGIGDPATVEATEFETYFAGWDGPEETEEESDLASVAESNGHTQTDVRGQEQAFASAPDTTTFSLASAQEDFNDDEKHDALADAVQAALLSVYGGQTSNAPAAPQRPLPAQGAAEVNTNEKLKQVSVQDGLSPQDVILNYFDYEVEVPRSPGDNFSPFMGHKEADQTASPRRAANAVQSAQSETGFRPVDDRIAGVATDKKIETQQRYEGPPAFQPPATIDTAKERATAANKDSGRLLGAAGIGLIGGIAIAATLAVFFINSYGPTLPGGDKSDKPQTSSRRDSGNRAANADRGNSTAAVPGNVAASDVSGEPGQPIALAISVQSTRPTEQTLLSITGVPEGVRLSVGVDAGGGNWLLPPKRLNSLTLTAPTDRTDSFELEAQLLDSNARTPLSEKKQFAVALDKRTPAEPTPAAQKSVTFSGPFEVQTQGASPVVTAPATRDLNAASASSLPAFNTQTLPAEALPAQKSPIPLEAAGPQTGRAPAASDIATSEAAARNANLTPPPAASTTPPASATQLAEMEDLIREGNKRMRDGDIVQARSLYSRAVVSGDADAALAMGRSFDPIYFERLDKKNAEPDAGKAFEWYKQAMDRGATQTAKMRIDNLKQYLNK